MLRQRLYSSKYSFFDKLKSIDYFLIFLILILAAISFMVMYSTDGGKIAYHTKNHFIRFSIFFALFLCLSFVRIKVWFLSSYIFYLIILAMLVVVFYFGVTASGSQRWINLYFINIQPSELMKISIIICLARYYHRMQSADVQSFKNIVLPLILLIIPCIFVTVQPDLGTAILIALSGVFVMWIAGLNIKYFFYSGIAFIVSAPFVISLLKPYQKLRILTFFNPERDPLGAGYQIIQSKIAIGSGGFFGKGFLKGTQSYLEFLPEKHTDFIFTLYAEEFGFIGCLFLLLLYILLIYRIIRIGFLSRSFFAKLYCFGFGAAIFAYMFVNMSMVLGILPIVGSPLPILSYGGSSMMTIMIGCAITMSCKIYSKDQVA